MTQRTFRLRHLLPSQWASALTSGAFEWREALAGIESLSIDDAARRVVVAGQPDAVRGLEKLTRLVDTPGRHVQVEMRLMESPAPFSAEDLIAATYGDRDRRFASAKVLCEARSRAVSGAPISTCLFFQGQLLRVQAVAHLNQDKSVSVQATASREEVEPEGAPQTLQQSGARSFRRLKSGQSLVLFADTQRRTYLLISATPTR